jgi:WD40 repeat protein
MCYIFATDDTDKHGFFIRVYLCYPWLTPETIMQRIISFAVCFVFLLANQLLAGETPGIIVLKGHKGRVVCAAFSPDGKKVITGGSDKVAIIWDVESGNATLDNVDFGREYYGKEKEYFAKELKRFEGHDERKNFQGSTDWILSVAFSPDGKTVLTGASDRTARIWDVETGKELKKFAGHTNVAEGVWSAAFSPDGKKVVTTGGQDTTVLIWDVESGRELKKLVGHTREVRSAAFSPDGKRVVTGSYDYTARIWDVETGKELIMMERELFNSVAFSPDGKKVVTNGGKNAVIYDAESGEELKRLGAHLDFVNAVAFSPDGKKVLTCSKDDTVRIWDVETGKELEKLEWLGHYAHSAAFSPDGKKVVTSGIVGARVWDLERLPPPRVPPAIMDF